MNSVKIASLFCGDTGKVNENLVSSIGAIDIDDIVSEMCIARERMPDRPFQEVSVFSYAVMITFQMTPKVGRLIEIVD